jgi:two-component system LytT family response regulator
MKPLRVIIVDDEPLARRGVRQLLAQHGDVQVLAEAKNGREAVTLINNLRPDVVFLDVQMPAVDGFEVLRRLDGQRMPWVIFVTAHDSFAVRAFDVHALDYLVKPLHEDRFHAALSRAREKLNSAEAVRVAERLTSLLEDQVEGTTRDAKAPGRLVVPSRNGELILEIDDIDWIEADDYYAAIHTFGRRVLMRESLDVLEGRLSRLGFLRVHRKALVNLAKVREVRIDTARARVLLSNGTWVPVSRRRRRAVAGAVRRIAG